MKSFFKTYTDGGIAVAAEAKKELARTECGDKRRVFFLFHYKLLPFLKRSESSMNKQADKAMDKVRDQRNACSPNYLEQYIYTNLLIKVDRMDEAGRSLESLMMQDNTPPAYVAAAMVVYRMLEAGKEKKINETAAYFNGKKPGYNQRADKYFNIVSKLEEMIVAGKALLAEAQAEKTAPSALKFNFKVPKQENLVEKAYFYNLNGADLKNDAKTDAKK
ncbi:MAG: hypothetical protein NTV88_03140 [Candidatus Micrarchaeota archaeon]|nr:hypothetical protein [Candidatus Micrarchaeota archaeon]